MDIRKDPHFEFSCLTGKVRFTSSSADMTAVLSRCAQGHPETSVATAQALVARGIRYHTRQLLFAVS